MKKIAIFSSLILSLSLFSQTQKLEFVTTVPDAEGSYVVIPNKEASKQDYTLGFVYYDDMAGYSCRTVGNINVNNDKLTFSVPEFLKNGMITSRIGNFGLQLAKLNPNTLKELKIQNPPEWLAIYNSSNPKDEDIVKRASQMNGAGAAKLALPKLKKLYDSNYKSELLYFELAFAYNALGDFTNAEKIASEAIKNKKDSDNLKKEYLYALVNQQKIKEAEDFVTKNEDRMTDPAAKTECYQNLAAFCASMDRLDSAKKWLAKVSAQPNAARYQRGIDAVNSIIKEKEKKIQ